MNLKMSAVVAAVGLTVAGCGSSSSSSAPDVSGGTASDQATLFRAANMAPVWDKVKAKTGAGFQGSVLKVEPRDIKLIAQGASGTEIVTVDNKGKSLVVKAPGGGSTPFALSLVDPAAGQRAVDAVRAKAHIGLSDISYLTFTADLISHKPGWGVYLRRGGYYSANAKGGHVVSHAGTGSGGVPPSAGGGSGSTQDTATCLKNAGTDVNKIRKCTSQ